MDGYEKRVHYLQLSDLELVSQMRGALSLAKTMGQDVKFVTYLSARHSGWWEMEVWSTT